MKTKITFRFYAITMLFCLALVACNKSETYTDKLKKERKEINRFIKEHGIKVIKDYPTDRPFEENEYFLDPESGVYIHVVDSGNGNRAKHRWDVHCRFEGAMTLPTAKSDTVPEHGEELPLSLVYEVPASYVNTDPTSISYKYLSAGIAAPLKYVGEKAVVKLIIPFGSGSTYQNITYQAIYYDKLKYIKIY